LNRRGVAAENLRFYKEEEKGDVPFSEKLSKLGEIYVNDAFVQHTGPMLYHIVAQFFKEKCAGLVMAAELANARKCWKTPLSLYRDHGRSKDLG